MTTEIQAQIDYSIHPDERKKIARVQHMVAAFMVEHVGQLVTPGEVRRALRLPQETEIQARLRDMRKPQHGAWQIDCERRDGTHKYRLRPMVSKVVEE